MKKTNMEAENEGIFLVFFDIFGQFHHLPRRSQIVIFGDYINISVIFGIFGIFRKTYI